MTIKFDKKLIFENEDDWSDFCTIANKHLRWSNPFKINTPFGKLDFYELRTETKYFIGYRESKIKTDTLFIGINNGFVYNFTFRQATEEEIKKYSWNEEKEMELIKYIEEL